VSLASFRLACGGGGEELNRNEEVAEGGWNQGGPVLLLAPS